MAEFQFIIDGKLEIFTKWEDIPDVFEHVIKFIPDIPNSPHNGDDHKEIAKWNARLQNLMEIERASSN